MSSLSSVDKVLSEIDDLSIPTYIGLKGKKLNLAISSICGVGFLLFGYDQGVMGSLLTLESFRKQFPSIDVVDNGDRATLQGFAIAVYELGCMTSALATIYLGDRLGRLRTIMLGMCIMFVGGALQAGSTKSIAFLIVARIISGLGNGFNTATVPVYQSETAKAHNRGKLICIQGSIITLGVCISYWIDFGFYFTSGEISWRFPVAFQCIFPLIMFPFILRLPESPRWLMKRGNQKEARRVFSALYDLPPNHNIINEQIMEIHQAIELEKSTNPNESFFSKVFSQGKTRNFQRLSLAFWSQILQQICGINLITYYAGTIFESRIGMSPLISRILAACNGTEYFLASIFTIFIIEKVGRRPLFIWGTTGQFFTMLFLFVTNYIAERDDNKGAGIGAAFLLFVFNTFFALSLLSLTWLYPPEIANLHNRAITASFSTAANWISNFAVVMCCQPMFEGIGSYTYLVFAGINLAMIPVFVFLYPETKGRTLEEMDLIFSKTPTNKPWQSVKIARELPYLHADLSRVGAEDDEMKLKQYADHIEVIENDSI